MESGKTPLLQWVPSLRRQPALTTPPALRLVAFPSSGTNESVFTAKQRRNGKMEENPLMAWAAEHSVQVLSVQLPGRTTRVKEPFTRSLVELAEAVADVLLPVLSQDDAPYCVLGHSMGAWAAYELCVCLLNRGFRPPCLFLPVCFPAPDTALAERPWKCNAALSEAELKDECRAWGMSEVALSEGIWQTFQALIRADFSLFDTYEMEEGRRLVLPCPITAFAAEKDSRISRGMLQGWEKFTSFGLDLAPTIEGGHLFLLNDQQKVQWFHQLETVLNPVLLSAGQGLKLGAATTVGLSGPPAQTSRPLRFLCLHGMGGSAEILRRQTVSLRKLTEAALAGKPGPGTSVEWDFIDGPRVASWDPASFQAMLLRTYFPDCSYYEWMRPIGDGAAANAAIGGKDGGLAVHHLFRRYVDWEESLDKVLRHLVDHGPFDGILGFSQGANLATLVAALAETGALPAALSSLQCVVVMAGSRFGWEKEWNSLSSVLGPLRAKAKVNWAPPKGDAADPSLFEQPLAMPSLHLMGKTDHVLISSEKLADLFDETTRRVVVHPEGHKPPGGKESAAAFADLIVSLATAGPSSSSTGGAGAAAEQQDAPVAAVPPPPPTPGEAM